MKQAAPQRLYELVQLGEVIGARCPDCAALVLARDRCRHDRWHLIEEITFEILRKEPH